MKTDRGCNRKSEKRNGGRVKKKRFICLFIEFEKKKLCKRGKTQKENFCGHIIGGDKPLFII